MTVFTTEKLASTSHRQYKADPTSGGFFKGTWDLDQDTLDRYDPFVGGYAYIVWTKLPKFFNKDIARNFKHMTEKNFKSFEGIEDLTLESETVSLGFAGNTMDVATNLKKSEAGFTLTHQEYSGSPIRKLYEYWITGIRDPETGLATYHGAIADGSVPYSARNHTAELLYIVTDPSGKLGGTSAIEFAAYYTNVFPTKVPQSHLNYSSGEHGVHDVSQEFKGVQHRSSKIDEIAGAALSSKVVLESFRDYGDGKDGMSEVKDYSETR